MCPVAPTDSCLMLLFPSQVEDLDERDLGIDSSWNQTTEVLGSPLCRTLQVSEVSIKSHLNTRWQLQVLIPH